MLREAMQHESNIVRSLWHFTSVRADVDEMLQEVWLRLASVKEHPNPKALALAVAHNLATDRCREQLRKPLDLISEIYVLEDKARDSEQAALQALASIDEQVESELELRRVIAAVMKLRTRDREVFTLRKVYGYTPWEIVKRTRLSIGQVEVALTRALAQLSIDLGSELLSHGQRKQRTESTARRFNLKR